ncbi:alpha/beta hydrolase [Pseudochrobactrum sp. HB0163]|uniref:alpha/beta hydrolase n=1 Tax=Pseudochrobactrum sp. HB0163 TaxID=3450708 RepID=UPI003F6DC5AC
MVNKFFSFSGSAVLAAGLVVLLPQITHAQTAILPAAPVNSVEPDSGKAAFIKKTDRMMPVPGGLTMHKPEAQVAKPKDGRKVVKDVISRSQKFIYHFTRPENTSGETIVLLHGSGGNETSLVPFAQKVWPRATLLGIRGRILQEGRTRWYARITPVKFDQKDVRHEANAFVGFLTKLASEEQIDLSRTTFVGYSNGANLLAATMMLHPDLVKKAVLMRSMPVLDQTPEANLSKTRVLVVTGAEDKMYAPFAPALSDLLRNSGAKVDARVVKAGHMIGDKDVALVTAWLSGQGPDGAPAMSQALPDKIKNRADKAKLQQGAPEKSDKQALKQPE